MFELRGGFKHFKDFLSIDEEQVYTETENRETELTEEDLERMANFFGDNREYFEPRHLVLTGALEFVLSKR